MSIVAFPAPTGSVARAMDKLPTAAIKRHARREWLKIANGKLLRDDLRLHQLGGTMDTRNVVADSWFWDWSRPFWYWDFTFPFSASFGEMADIADEFATRFSGLVRQCDQIDALLINYGPELAGSTAAGKSHIIEQFILQTALAELSENGIGLTINPDELLYLIRNGKYAFLLETASRAGFDVTRLFPPLPKSASSEDIATARLANIARMQDAAFWRRSIKTQAKRHVEQASRATGFVSCRRDTYVTDHNITVRRAQNLHNSATLAAFDMINELGQTFSLSELVEKSQANPACRRAELMTRIAGFETVARDLDHVGEFVTFTCPSAYHPRLHKTGEENKKYRGACVRTAATYLQKVWAKIQAALLRADIRIYGFRIAEPHHDGTPHWHMLFFMPRKSRRPFRRIVARYACRAYRGELGLNYYDTLKAARTEARLKQDAQRRASTASGQKPQTLKDIMATMRTEVGFWAAANRAEFKSVQARVKFLAIDWHKGSAAGYIAKYIAKNIDGKNAEGESVGMDDEDPEIDLIQSSERVTAWAATWGVRQFQQIGGPPVGLWRETRRLEPADAQGSETLSRAFCAADEGDWATFTMILGGVACRRRDRLLQTYKEDADPQDRTRYGEPRGPITRGIIDVKTGVFGISRPHVWQVVRRGARDALPWTCVNNSTKNDFDHVKPLQVGGYSDSATAQTLLNTLTPAKRSDGGKSYVGYSEDDIAMLGLTNVEAEVYRDTSRWYINPQQAADIIERAQIAAEKAGERSNLLDMHRKLLRSSPMPAGIIPKPPPIRIPRVNEKFTSKAIVRPKRPLTLEQTIAESQAALEKIIARQAEREAQEVALFRQSVNQNGAQLSLAAQSIMRILKKQDIRAQQMQNTGPKPGVGSGYPH